MSDFEMPPVAGARSYTPKIMSQIDALTLLNKIVGIGARAVDDHVEYALSDFIYDTTEHAFRANPFDATLLDEAAAKLTLADNDTPSDKAQTTL